MQWLMGRYVAEEAQRLGLDLQVHALLPLAISPETELGRSAAVAYAQRSGLSVAKFLERFGPALTPAMVGDSVVRILTDPAYRDVYRFQVTGRGLQPLPIQS